jgi:hypothetical protein
MTKPIPGARRTRNTEQLRAAIRTYYDTYGVVPRTKDMEDWYSWCRKNFENFQAERAAALPFTVRTEAMLREEIVAFKARAGHPPAATEMLAWYAWCSQRGLDFVRIRDAVLGCRVLAGSPTSRTVEMLRADIGTFIAVNSRRPKSREMWGWYQWCTRYRVSFIEERETAAAKAGLGPVECPGSAAVDRRWRCHPASDSRTFAT